MNNLPHHKQVTVVCALVEGCSIRATERLTGVHRDTVMRLGHRVGLGCQKLHDAIWHDLNVTSIELDEIWSYVHTKQKRVRDDDPKAFGDQYTFIAMDGINKGVISYHVGKRDDLNTEAFVNDVRRRVLNKPQISSDGFGPYISAIEIAFGTSIKYAQIVKEKKNGRLKNLRRERVFGNPDMDKLCTSFVERQNLTMRMHMRRFIRRSNGFSKKLANLKAAVALHVAWYNLCRVHETLKVTPAMEMGVASTLWSMSDLVGHALDLENARPN